MLEHAQGQNFVFCFLFNSFGALIHVVHFILFLFYFFWTEIALLSVTDIQ